MVSPLKAIVPVLMGVVAFMYSEQPAECHKGHCHGPKLKMCGGGWKDFKEAAVHVGPKGGADNKSAACNAARAELVAKLASDAPKRCPELHPCATCPKRCTGCKQQNPLGRIVDKKRVHTSAKTDANGRWSCEVRTEVAFRCRCSPCKVKSAQR